MTETEELAILRHGLEMLDAWREKRAQGKIASTLKERVEEKIDHKDGKALWTAAVNSDGYPKIKDDGELRLTSHVVLEQAGRKIPAGAVVMHKDNNPKNLALSNLSVGTQQKNLKHMRDEGRDRPRGVAQSPDKYAAFFDALRDILQEED